MNQKSNPLFIYCSVYIIMLTDFYNIWHKVCVYAYGVALEYSSYKSLLADMIFG